MTKDSVHVAFSEKLGGPCVVALQPCPRDGVDRCPPNHVQGVAFHATEELDDLMQRKEASKVAKITSMKGDFD